VHLEKDKITRERIIKINFKKTRSVRIFILMKDPGIISTWLNEDGGGWTSISMKEEVKIDKIINCPNYSSMEVKVA
jgi:hypothetical protein